MEWLIKNIVFPSVLNSSIFLIHFAEKLLSPTDKASSIITISGFRFIDIENPNLDFIPLE